MFMSKRIIFWAVVVFTAVLALVENATIGLPVVNMSILAVCGLLLGAGLVYMKMSLYKKSALAWCLAGGLALTFFIVIGAHFANCLPVVIDALHLGAIVSLLLCIATAFYVTVIYCAALYLFAFVFCDLRSKLNDFK